MLLCGRKEAPRVKSEVRRRGNRNSHQQIDGCHRQVIGNGRPAASPAGPKIQKNKKGGSMQSDIFIFQNSHKFGFNFF
jgi:hypothetical protein